jgi:hypothetical protein
MKKHVCLSGRTTSMLMALLLFAVQLIAAPAGLAAGQTVDPRTQNIQKVQPPAPTMPPRKRKITTLQKTPIKTNLNVSLYADGYQQLDLSPVVYQNKFCDAASAAGACLNPRDWFVVPALRVALVKYNINFTKGVLTFHQNTTIQLDCTRTPTGGNNCVTPYNERRTSLLSGQEAQQQCNRVPSPGNHATTKAVYEYPTSWSLSIFDNTGKDYFEESYFPVIFNFRCHW